MSTTGESTVQAFERYQQTEASELRYVQARVNIAAMHDFDRPPDRPLDVLDAASGNGISSSWLLDLGRYLQQGFVAV